MPARPQYFLVRPGSKKQAGSSTVVQPGPLVPLIAVDQLPEWIDIVGVPRELKVEQTIGLTNLGTVAKPEGCYRMCIASETPTTLLDAPQPSSSSPPPPMTPPRATMSEQPKPAESAAPTTTQTRPAAGLAASIHAAGWLSGPPPPPPPPTSITRKPESTSAYCRHWCHHGTCKWGYNCRYQHAMPTTVDGLREVGLADFPAWWTAAMELAFASGLGGAGARAGAGAMGFMNPMAAAARMAMLGSVHGGAGSLKKQKKLHELRQLMAAGLGLGLGGGGGGGGGAMRPPVITGYPVVEAPVLLAAERTESDREREKVPETAGKQAAAEALLRPPAPAEKPHDIIVQELEEKLVDI